MCGALLFLSLSLCVCVCLHFLGGCGSVPGYFWGLQYCGHANLYSVFQGRGGGPSNRRQPRQDQGAPPESHVRHPPLLPLLPPFTPPSFLPSLCRPEKKKERSGGRQGLIGAMTVLFLFFFRPPTHGIGLWPPPPRCPRGAVPMVTALCSPWPCLGLASVLPTVQECPSWGSPWWDRCGECKGLSSP